MGNSSGSSRAAARGQKTSIQEVVAASRRLGFQARWAAGILVLNLGAIVFEGIGIGIFLPILEFMNNNGDVASLAEKSKMWAAIVSAFQAFSLPLTLGTLLVIAFGSLLMRQAFTYCRLVYLARTQNQFLWTVRNRAFSRFMNATLVYHDGVRPGEFVNEISAELDRSISCITSVITLVGYLILCAVYSIALFVMSPPMTVIAVSVIVVAIACLQALLRQSQKTGHALTDANQSVSRFLIERLRNVRLVRLSRTEGAESNAMRYLTNVQRHQNVTLQTLKAIVSVLIEPIVVGVAFVILYLAVGNFGLALEQILIFFFIGMRLLPVVKEMTLVRQSILGTMASVKIIDRRLQELETAQDSDDGQLIFGNLRNGIQFNGVTYSYPATGSAAPALRGVNLLIPAGKMTALVGPSGAGKSTLVDLLPRLREIDSGEILVDGEPHTSFRKSTLRAGIAYTPQEPQIFNGSATEHIRYGKADATEAEIAEAARLAHADTFLLALPDGYNTPLGENGNRLSGGQRQRLDLARALVGQAPILILDEPTSNLDADSEFEFRKALDTIRARGNVTIILIGHRLSTIAAADQIAVLQHGAITEVGLHDELLSNGGWYAKATTKQGDPNLRAVNSRLQHEDAGEPIASQHSI